MNLPLEDKITFNLMNQGKLNGIFQMESTGMQELSRQLHIDKFEEIIAVVALYRPGPMEMIPSFIARKHGKEPIEITSGDQFKIEVQDLAGKTWKLTRMEFSHAEGGYYSVDGYQLDQGMPVEFLGGRFSP